jgi:8-oxo-dGTP diphosphatase
VNFSEEAGLDADALNLGQFGVYGDPGRDPRGRVVSVACLAIAPRLPEPVAGTDAVGACWTPVDQVLASRLKLAFDQRSGVSRWIPGTSTGRSRALAVSSCRKARRGNQRPGGLLGSSGLARALCCIGR